MDIINNDHTLFFNLFAFVTSLVLLNALLLGSWIVLIEFNIRLNRYRQRKADIQILNTAEELYDDFI